MWCIWGSQRDGVCLSAWGWAARVSVRPHKEAGSRLDQVWLDAYRLETKIQTWEAPISSSHEQNWQYGKTFRKLPCSILRKWIRYVAHGISVWAASWHNRWHNFQGIRQLQLLKLGESETISKICSRRFEHQSRPPQNGSQNPIPVLWWQNVQDEGKFCSFHAGCLERESRQSRSDDKLCWKGTGS